MVPISVTGVHNCLSNCFITGEEAWAPSALFHHIWILGSPLLSFNMYLLAAVISQERVIYLYADFDSNAFNGNSQGRWGWRAYGNLLMCRTCVFLPWMNVKKNKTCVSVVWCSSEVQKVCPRSLWAFLYFIPCMVTRPLRFPSRDLLS